MQTGIYFCVPHVSKSDFLAPLGQNIYSCISKDLKQSPVHSDNIFKACKLGLCIIDGNCECTYALIDNLPSVQLTK